MTGANSYSLGDLAEYLDLTDPANKPPKRSANDDKVSQFAGLGRNCDTFDYLRFIAYALADRMAYRALYNHLLSLAVDFNSRFKQPLMMNELMCICRSIARFCKSQRFGEYSEQFIAKQREQGRKGGLVSDSSFGGKARSAKYDDKRTQAKLMYNDGIKISDIAKALNTHRNSVSAWIKA